MIEALPDGIDEIIVVDNNCTDHSVRVAREHGATVIAEEEAGYGAAIRCGFAAAIIPFK